MPNHLHGILFLHGDTSDRFEHRARRFGDCPGGSLGSVVGAFKAAVTRLGREQGLVAGGTPLWQRGYWEHVVRSPSDLDRIREYVETNPARWDLDRENAARTGRDDFDAWVESLATTTPR
jgi:REP element-mobilizing transposase RayT